MRLWIVTGAIAKSGAFEKSLAQGADLLKKYGIEAELYRRFDINYTLHTDGSVKLFAKGVETTAPDKLFLYGSFDAIMEGIEKTLTSMGTVSINSVESKRIAGSKLSTALLLSKHDIPQAKTMPVYRDTPIELIKKEIGIPLIVKPDNGFGGQGVELIKTEEELKQTLDALPENIHSLLLAQEFISTSKGRDLRVLMVGKKPYAAFVRQAGDPNEFRSNIHQGGHYEDFELTDEIIDLCEKTAKAINLEICGLDLLFGKDGFIIGEINDSPGMKTVIEKVGLDRFLKTLMA